MTTIASVTIDEIKHQGVIVDRRIQLLLACGAAVLAMDETHREGGVVSHTPGPWRVSTVDGDPWEVQSKDRTIVNVESATMADACLIAAAPELLSLLKRLWEWDHLIPLGGEMKDVIAKAEGSGSQAASIPQEKRWHFDTLPPHLRAEVELHGISEDEAARLLDDETEPAS